MVVNAKLSKRSFIRLAILRSLQRPTFYFFAVLCAVITTYAIVQGSYRILLAGWVPFAVYILIGVIGAVRAGNAPNNPVLAPTRYTFTEEGIKVRSGKEEGEIRWNQVRMVQRLLDCYVMTLVTGQIVVFPRSAVPAAQSGAFEAMLRERVGRRP
jgi:hypothetical protein